jgi:hypothetical protein
MNVYLILAGLFFVFAILFLFMPYLLIFINKVGNKLLFTDERVIVYRISAGIILCIAALLFIYLGWKWGL